MKKILICILLITSILLVSCDQFPIGMYNMTTPRDYDDSMWRSTDPDMWFTVDIIYEAEPSNSKIFTPPVVSKGEFYHNGKVYNINLNFLVEGEISVYTEINGESIYIFGLQGTSSSEEYFKCKFDVPQSDPLNLEGVYDDVELVRILVNNKNLE